ncbi:hypothetical protein QQS21_002162 [Conoideocrella luteorostrata]|uniref:Aminoglycoside phosphotransferase n=1 Tax=Conoideocrella luteorostrata TaxID=1105319 RepID=A0AAJ0FXH7_9HYPO|nr:hypothetical protein QQS21_002162 [Conoideocrella luteorostrata]
MPAPRPSDQALSAFRVQHDLVPLDGGRSLCYLAGDVVLKPSDEDEESQWIAAMVDRYFQGEPASEYTLARPIPTVQDAESFVFDGWTASSLLPGRDGARGHFKESLRVSQAFHRDLQKLAPIKPAFLDKRTNRWSEADRVTWGEKQLSDVAKINDEISAFYAEPLCELKAMMGPLPAHVSSQLIHADMAGNILWVDDGKTPPGIIDLSFHWRPFAYPEAIIVADGMAWHGQGRELIEFYGTDEVKLQLLVRALYWRCLTLTIDPIIEWVRQHAPRSDYHGAARLLREILNERQNG